MHIYSQAYLITLSYQLENYVMQDVNKYLMKIQSK